MLEVKVTWKRGFRFDGVDSQGRPMKMDASVGAGGEGDGFRPAELPLMGLAGCTGMDTVELARGQLQRFELPAGQKGELEIRPTRGVDFGAGRGRMVRCTVEGGEIGVLLDGRGNPLSLPRSWRRRQEALRRWHNILNLETEVEE